MGTAILTNLNGMTNPPSDLNEITTGWKFFKKTITLPEISKTFTYPAGNNWRPYHISGLFDPVVISDYLPNSSGVAVMILNSATDSTVSGTFPIKKWPSNPTTDNILNQTGSPLTIIFDSFTTAKTPADPPSASTNGLFHIASYQTDTSTYSPKYSLYGKLSSTSVLTLQNITISYNFICTKFIIETYDSDDNTWASSYYPDQNSGVTMQNGPANTPYTVTLPSKTITIYGWYLPA